MALTSTERTIDYVIRELKLSVDDIKLAHESLGLPLEDVLVGVVRRALDRPACHVHEPELFDEEERGTS